MHPELQHALDANISALEMIKAFRKHHSGVQEGDIEILFSPELRKLRHNDTLFWDTWQPLLGDVGASNDPKSAPTSEAFFSIHKDLTKDIISWLGDSQRRSNVYVILEAQTQTNNWNENHRANTFAMICYDAHRFGLPLFQELYFTRSDRSPICTLLAACYPPFRPLFAKALIDNADFSELQTRTYLKKLILEPWKTLQGLHPRYTTAPPVIILRCFHLSQVDLFRSICELASSPHASPLLWIISIDPKFTLPIHGYLGPLSFQCNRLPICYHDAHVDTDLYLRHRFGVLRRKHEEIFDEHEVWPTEEQMSHLTRIFSGVFDSIDVLGKFVDWEGDGGPKAHLKTFLAYMVDSPLPSEEHPYHALDHFYTRVFAAIPPGLLSVVTRLISAFHFAHRIGALTAFQLACLFSLEYKTVLDILPRFCRCTVSSSTGDEPVYYQRCPFFAGFLEATNRSGHLYTPVQRTETVLVAYGAYLRVLSHSPSLITSINPAGSFDPKAQAAEIKNLMHHAAVAFCNFSDTNKLPVEWTLLRHFDFRCLAHTDSPWILNKVFPFLIKLHSWGRNNLPNIVRIEPLCDLDWQFIDKCEGLATPLV